jgi:RNA polymerase sigma factor (sigma-70 family)
MPLALAMAVSPPSSTSVPSAGAQFPPTLWSVVLAAGEAGSTRAQEALSALCQTYWYPLYSFLRRQGKGRHDAEDLTQAFFVHLLESSGLEKVRRERGKFRSFLLSALKHFVIDEWAKASAQKRGGGTRIVSLDADHAEAMHAAASMDHLHAEALFERRWAMTLLDRVLSRLETEWTQAGKRERFEQLGPFLSGEPQTVTYAEIGQRLGMTPGAVKVAVLRLRQRYRELLREEVANTVPGESDVDEELRHLLSIVAS